MIVTLSLGIFAHSCSATEKDMYLRGRVWAVIEDWLPHTGMSDRFQQFVFGVESEDHQGERVVTPVLVNYLIPGSDDTLPKLFLDYSNLLELHVNRLPYDKTLESVALIKYLTADNKEAHPPDIVMRILDGAPTDVLRMDMTLPYYELLPKGYRSIDTINESPPNTTQ